MPFERLPKGKGKIWIPENKKGRKQKHPCKDCFSCEHCSDDRCNVCRNDQKKNRDISPA